ncbi:MAG: tetratricopeptide repeat protein [Candidatus Methanoperedens sp.]|nr:tetratricopeptide repeat protein [Candidatus Methanoperedens sp.]
MLGVIIAVILFGVGLPQTFDTSLLQWTPGVSGKLLIGETLTYRGYSVQVVTFPAQVESQKYKAEPEEPVDPFVGFNISKNGTFISTAVLRLGESYITPDGELKVTAKELPGPNGREWLYESYAPWAVIELNPRGTPQLEVSVQTDKDAYESSDSTDITATVKLENTGAADAVNVDLIIDTGLPIMEGTLKYHYDKIKPGDAITETITFDTPILAEHKIFSISANVSGYDVKDIPYTAKFLKSISMAAEIPVKLSIQKSTVNKMYLKDYTIVSLYVKNNGRYDAENVNISDSLPDSFKLLSNQMLRWIVDIPAGGEWTEHYLVRPQEANKEGAVMPAATADFTFNNEFYSIQSNQPKIIVYGPKIVLTKKTDVSVFNPGDIVTVTVIAENTGSTITRVAIMDTLPDKTTLVSGSTIYEGLVDATKNVSLKYNIRIDSGEPVIFPAATAQYYELGSKGRKISTKSQELEVQPESAQNKSAVPTPQVTIATPTPEETITSTTPMPPAPPESPVILEPLNTVLELLGKPYNYLNSMISGEPKAGLSISKTTVDTMYLKDYADISISVKNTGAYDLNNVNITDSLPIGFNLLINQSLQWVIDIPAGGEREYRYYIKPQEPSKEGIVIPAAIAEFTSNNELYSIRSNQPKIVVIGPKIVLNKQADISQVGNGDTVIVTVVAQNSGNAPANVVITDKLPDKTSLVGGNTMYDGIIEADTKVSLNYTLRMDSKEPIKLPAATAQYYEFDSIGRKISAQSQELEIQLNFTQKNPVPISQTIIESKFFMWTYILIAIILIGLVIYISMKYKKSITVNEKAIQVPEKTMEVMPKDADGWYNRGFDLYKQGKYSEAIKAYDKAREISHPGFGHEKEEL